MDGRNRNRSLATRGRVIRVAILAFIAVATPPLSGRPVGASAIKTAGVVVTDINSLGPAWAAFLEEGLARAVTLGQPNWYGLIPPTIPTGLVYPKQANGLLVETPFVEYLFWRRKLDPVRFDSYHPNIGPQLGLLTPPSTTTGTPTPTPGGTSTGGGPVPETINTPEPGSVVIALALIGSAVGWGRHARRSAARP